MIHPSYQLPPIESPENLKLHRDRPPFIHNYTDNRVWELSLRLAKASESLHHKLERYHADRWEVFRHHLDGHSEQVLEYAQSLIDILRKKEEISTQTDEPSPRTTHETCTVATQTTPPTPVVTHTAPTAKKPKPSSTKSPTKLPPTTPTTDSHLESPNTISPKLRHPLPPKPAPTALPNPSDRLQERFKRLQAEQDRYHNRHISPLEHPPLKGSLEKALKDYEAYIASMEAYKKPPACRIFAPPQEPPQEPPQAPTPQMPPPKPLHNQNHDPELITTSQPKVPCRFYQLGICKYDSACKFSHDIGPPKDCPWQATGQCKYGHRCTFRHSQPNLLSLLEPLLVHLSTLLKCNLPQTISYGHP